MRRLVVPHCSQLELVRGSWKGVGWVGGGSSLTHENPGVPRTVQNHLHTNSQRLNIVWLDKSSVLRGNGPSAWC